MCDTMVALSSVTENERTLFAKNSDRSPNEPHVMIYEAPRNYEEGEMLQCTYLQIPQVSHTYGCVLLKPSWIWGAEMGWNEFDLNIGNEAVFTKEKHGKEKGLIGMDLIRLALERARDPMGAIEVITECIETYGQNGNCGYDHSFHYHNSFLISNAKEAYLLETAGKFWVAKAVVELCSISNELTITNDYDFCSPGLLEYCIKHNLCKGKGDFNFHHIFCNRLMTHFCGAKERRKSSIEALESEKGKLSIDKMLDILRLHHRDVEKKMPAFASVRSVCMHAGNMIGDHTTGSYVADLSNNPGHSVYWVSGSSLPCISIFKPVFHCSITDVLFAEPDDAKAKAFWLKREQLHRHILAGNVDMSDYISKARNLETKFIDQVSAANFENKQELKELSRQCFREENELVEHFLTSCNEQEKHYHGIRYGRYWRKKDKNLR